MEFLDDITSNAGYATSVAKYILQKHHDSVFGDLIPIILANVLSVTINIWDTNEDGDINEIIIHPRDGAKERAIVLQRSTDHFNGVSINEGIPPNYTPAPNSQENKTYSRSLLLSLKSSHHKIDRQARKRLFKYNLWLPPTNLNTAKFVQVTSCSQSNALITIPTTSKSCEPLGINIGTWNARSLNNKASAASDLILENNLDILVVTESWLSASSINSTMAQILTALGPYDYLSCNRKGRSGGGICVLFNEALSVKKQNSFQFKSFELFDLLVTSGSDILRLVTVYRPPPSKNNQATAELFLTEFSSFLEILAIAEDHLLITGDFNIHVDNSSCPFAAKFTDMLYTTGLEQHVVHSTHRSGHTLDLMISRTTDHIMSSVLVIDVAISDHSLITTTLKLSRPPTKTKMIKYRQLRKIDIPTLCNDIKTRFLTEKSVDLCCNELTLQYNKELALLIDQHAPLRQKKTRKTPSAPWFNDITLAARSVKRRNERLWKKTRLTVHYEIFQASCRQYYSTIEASKRNLYANKIMTADSRKMFQVVKELTTITTHALPSHNDAVQLANDFSDYFANKVSKIRQALDATPTDECDNAEVCLKPDTKLQQFYSVSESDVKKVIMKYPAKSCKLDPMPAWLVRDCLNVLIGPITRIINSSFTNGFVPLDLKRAIVIPSLKKPSMDKENLANYRPISNLTYLSKVMERAVAQQLHDYLRDNALYDAMQSAYRPNHSTETALLRVQNDILMALDKGDEVILCLLDLSSAFDTINHGILLHRLENRFGLTGTALAWLSSYLHQRDQTVIVDTSNSSPQLLTTGVPQGSVLGPVLFTMYMSPLGDLIRTHGCSYMCYADDTQLYFEVQKSKFSNSLSSIQRCVNGIKSWMTKNKLQLNDGKTEILHIRSRFRDTTDKNISIAIGDTDIVPSETVRNLGIVFDSHMKMDSHVRSAVRSSYLALRNIGRIRSFLDEENTAKLVHAFISSRIDYCNSLLYGIPDSTLVHLQRLQNSAARLVSRVRKSEHITPVLRSLHWLPVRQRIAFKILLMSHKVIYGNAPVYLQDLVQLYKPSRLLRSSSTCSLVPAKYKTVTYGSRAFAVSSATLWNQLPSELKDCDETSLFKTKLKTFLFKQAYY